MKHTETKLTHLSLAPKTKELMGVVNMPVAPGSTLTFESLADFDAGERGEYDLPVYGRYGNPTTLALEAALAELEGADFTRIYGSGMQAITVSLLAFLNAGDHLLMVDNVYSPTRRACEQLLKRLGIEVTYYNPTIGSEIAELMQDNTKVLYLESPGSLTFEVQDIDVLVGEAKKRNILVIADNTWVTPLHFKPFDHGIDISMHAATKYIAGHSDLLMGMLSCKKEHAEQLEIATKNIGGGTTANDAFLALRGLRSMHVRMERHQKNALEMAEWLQGRDEVSEVYYPALSGSRGHDLWKKYYTGACGLFGFKIKKDYNRKQLGKMLDGMKLFAMGYSWGGFESLLIPSKLQGARTATDIPQDGTVMRIHIGLEHTDDLKADLEAGFARLHD